MQKTRMGGMLLDSEMGLWGLNKENGLSVYGAEFEWMGLAIVVKTQKTACNADTAQKLPTLLFGLFLICISLTFQDPGPHPEPI